MALLVLFKFWTSINILSSLWSLNKFVFMQCKREHCRTAYYASGWEIERVSRACSLYFRNFAILFPVPPLGMGIEVIS